MTHQPERRIVTICGSTRFRTQIAEANRQLTLEGWIVLAPGVFAHDGDTITEQQKAALDRLHFDKIDLSEAIYVVNPGQYVGESTSLEITYARKHGKTIMSLEPVDGQAPPEVPEVGPLQVCPHGPTARIEAYRPVGGHAHGSLDWVVYTCTWHLEQHRDRISNGVRVAPNDYGASFVAQRRVEPYPATECGEVVDYLAVTSRTAPAASSAAAGE